MYQTFLQLAEGSKSFWKAYEWRNFGSIHDQHQALNIVTYHEAEAQSPDLLTTKLESHHVSFQGKL